MVSLKPIVVQGSRRQDGTYLVYIRIYHAGKSRRIPTTVIAQPSDLTRSGRIKSAEVLRKCEPLLRRMRDALARLSPFDLEDRDVDWVVGRIKADLTAGDFQLDFFSFADTMLKGMTPGTRKAYAGALNALERYLGKRSIDVNDITRVMMSDFASWVDSQPKVVYLRHKGKTVATDKAKLSGNTAARHLGRLSHIFTAARERYNDEDAGTILIPRTPFTGIHVSVETGNAQRSIGKDAMQMVISGAQEESGLLGEALSLFVLSFCLCGANIADLYAATQVGPVWVYNRQKTRDRRADRAEIHVTIPPEALPFLARLQDGPRGWWIPALHRIGADKDLATTKVNRYVKKWCEDQGLPVFTYYAARHTWATLARRSGVEKATVDDALGHKGDFDVADIYAERAWDLVDDANRKVLDLFNWDAGPDSSTSE